QLSFQFDRQVLEERTSADRAYLVCKRQPVEKVRAVRTPILSERTSMPPCPSRLARQTSTSLTFPTPSSFAKNFRTVSSLNIEPGFSMQRKNLLRLASSNSETLNTG